MACFGIMEKVIKEQQSQGPVLRRQKERRRHVAPGRVTQVRHSCVAVPVIRKRRRRRKGGELMAVISLLCCAMHSPRLVVWCQELTALSPTSTPTLQPDIFIGTEQPTPVRVPTSFPTHRPTGSPTRKPTKFPTSLPTPSPTSSPTLTPTLNPTVLPTASPTVPKMKEVLFPVQMILTGVHTFGRKDRAAWQMATSEHVEAYHSNTTNNSSMIVFDLDVTTRYITGEPYEEPISTTVAPIDQKDEGQQTTLPPWKQGNTTKWQQQNATTQGQKGNSTGEWDSDGGSSRLATNFTTTQPSSAPSPVPSTLPLLITYAQEVKYRTLDRTISAGQIITEPFATDEGKEAYLERLRLKGELFNVTAFKNVTNVSDVVILQTQLPPENTSLVQDLQMTLRPMSPMDSNARIVWELTLSSFMEQFWKRQFITGDHTVLEFSAANRVEVQDPPYVPPTPAPVVTTRSPSPAPTFSPTPAPASDGSNVAPVAAETGDGAGGTSHLRLWRDGPHFRRMASAIGIDKNPPLIKKRQLQQQAPVKKQPRQRKMLTITYTQAQTYRTLDPSVTPTELAYLPLESKESQAEFVQMLRDTGEEAFKDVESVSRITLDTPMPTSVPTNFPSLKPSFAPTFNPTISPAPSTITTWAPSSKPSPAPVPPLEKDASLPTVIAVSTVTVFVVGVAAFALLWCHRRGIPGNNQGEEESSREKKNKRKERGEESVSGFSNGTDPTSPSAEKVGSGVSEVAEPSLVSSTIVETPEKGEESRSSRASTPNGIDTGVIVDPNVDVRRGSIIQEKTDSIPVEPVEQATPSSSVHEQLHTTSEVGPMLPQPQVEEEKKEQDQKEQHEAEPQDIPSQSESEDGPFLTVSPIDDTVLMTVTPIDDFVPLS